MQQNTSPLPFFTEAMRGLKIECHAVALVRDYNADSTLTGEGGQNQQIQPPKVAGEFFVYGIGLDTYYFNLDFKFFITKFKLSRVASNFAIC